MITMFDLFIAFAAVVVAVALAWHSWSRQRKATYFYNVQILRKSGDEDDFKYEHGIVIVKASEPPKDVWTHLVELTASKYKTSKSRINVTQFTRL